MEQIVFPVPNICEFLTPESKIDAYQTCERDDQNSKVTDLPVISTQWSRQVIDIKIEYKLKGVLNFFRRILTVKELLIDHESKPKAMTSNNNTMNQ